MKTTENFQFEITETHVKILTEHGWTKRGIRKGDTVERIKGVMIQEQREKAEHKEWREKLTSMSPEELVNSEYFAYTRYKEYGVAIYVRSKWSPTGVENVGGMSHEEGMKLTGTKSPLSPTEDLRTAR